MHAILLPDNQLSDELVTVEGEEAHHALRVRRMRPGETVLLLNGAGVLARATVQDAGRALRLRVLSRQSVPPVRPAVHVLSAVPKGPRLSDLIDALVQTGAASWTPLACEQSVAEAGAHKLERTQRIVDEACKQSRRAWRMRVNDPIQFDQALGAARPPGSALILADALGERYHAASADEITLLIGPEGGFTPRELDAARAAGAALCSFGPHVMRIETAAPVACAVVLNVERQPGTTH